MDLADIIVTSNFKVVNRTVSKHLTLLNNEITNLNQGDFNGF